MAASRLSVRILGSGSPFSSQKRVSSSALVYVDDMPRILVDAGGGVFERIGEAKIEITEIDMIVLTHTHIDHTGGLAPLIFDMTMRGRTKPIAIVGPMGRDQHPGARRFANQLFGEVGAWSYLNTFENFSLEVAEQPPHVDLDAHFVECGTEALAADGVRIRSIGVPHGMMPSLGYRVELGDKSVTFTGDVSHYTTELVQFARGTTLLVCDMALPEREVEHENLHLKPSAVGRFARDTGAQTLVVTHVMPELEDEIDQALVTVRLAYAGPIHVAADKATFAVG